MKRLWYWYLDYVYVVWWQVRAVFSRRVPSRFAQGDGRPVLLIAGVYEPWYFLRGVARRLNDGGHPVHVVGEIGYNRASVAHVATLASRYLDAHDLSRVIVVAHSKGGLVGKQLMTSSDRVESLIAIATPFSGSTYANFLYTRALREFRPSGATITELAAASGPNGRITSIYATFDPHIPGGSHLEGATNVVVDTVGHFRLLADARVLEAIDLAAGVE